MPKGDNGRIPAEAGAACFDDTGARPLPPEQAVLSIENVATMFGVSQLTLRYYEWRGLIGRRQQVGRVRVYSWADCERLAFIIKCRQARLPLGDVVMIAEAAEDDVGAAARKFGQERC